MQAEEGLREGASAGLFRSSRISVSLTELPLMKPACFAAFAGVLCGMIFASPLSASVTVIAPRCEYAENPLGVDAPQPRLSWILDSKERGQRQSAYRVLAATSQQKLRTGDYDLWDSGKVAGDRSIQVLYEGKPLNSRQRCFWKVCVWDQDGRQAESEPAYWEMGLLKPEDWNARWIGFTPGVQNDPLRNANWIWYPEGNPAANAPQGARLFRRVFALPANAAIRSAKLTITVDDQFTLYVNSEQVGKSSGQVDAWKEKNTYDLTSRLRPGQNFLAVKAFNNASAAGLLARLEVACDPGPKLEIISDESWKTSATESENWFRPDYNDADWKGSRVVAKLGEGPWGRVLSGEMALGQVPHLRKWVSLKKKIKQARLYASALGVYEIHVNGKRLGHDVFNPGWTDYKTRVHYHTYDITSRLEAGKNAFGIILGDGWYAGYVGLGGPHRYGAAVAALAQVEIEFTDGSYERIVTDASWKAANGPLLQSDMLMGETYDARREMPGWDTPSFDDSGWAAVQTPDVTATRLVAAPDGPVRKMLELKPQAISEPQPGHYVFDLGQNMVGWARLRVKGQAGTTVTLRFVEMLNPDGTIYTTNLRGAKATDYYTLKGGGVEVWEPRFTFHGFRYVELTGLPGKPDLDAVTGVVLYSDTPEAGSFECSNPLVN